MYLYIPPVEKNKDFNPIYLYDELEETHIQYDIDDKVIEEKEERGIIIIDLF